MGYPLDAATAAPRPVRLGDTWYMVRPLPLWGLGMLHAHLRDARAGVDDEPGRLDAEGLEHLLSPDGLPTMLFASLRPSLPEFTFGSAILLAAELATDVTAKRELLEAAFYRAPRNDWPPRSDEQDGQAIHEVDWARCVWDAARGRGYEDAANLSLDQMHVELSGGKAGEPRRLTAEEAQRIWEGGISGQAEKIGTGADDGAKQSEESPVDKVDESIPPEGATQVELNGITAWELPDHG